MPHTVLNAGYRLLGGADCPVPWEGHPLTDRPCPPLMRRLTDRLPLLQGPDGATSGVVRLFTRQPHRDGPVISGERRLFYNLFRRKHRRWSRIDPAYPDPW